MKFSIILQQLFEKYNSMVSTGNTDELCRTVLAWFEQRCTLPALRPGETLLVTQNVCSYVTTPFSSLVVMSSLRELSVKTSILSDPSQVPQQLTQYAKDDV